MKAKKLTGLLALASCVMLAGCDKPEINVKDMPTEFVLGQVIDLDNYISYGNSKDFKVVPTDESASKVEVNGHKVNLLVKDEVKDIKLRIIAGDAEKEVSFNTISQVRVNIASLLNGDIGYNYNVYELTYESQTSDKLVVNGGIYHNKDYVYADNFIANDYSYVPGGYVNTSYGPYVFTTGKKFKDPVVNPEVISNKTYKSSNIEFNLDLSQFVYQPQDEETLQDSLLWVDDGSYALEDFLMGTAFYQEFDEYYQQSFIPVIGEFFTVEAGEGESKHLELRCKVYAMSQSPMTGETGIYEYGNYAFEFLKAPNSIPDLDTFVAENKKPQPIDHSKLDDFLKLVANNKNYTVETKYQWFNSKKQEIDVPSFKDNSYYFEEGLEPLFPNGTQQLAVTADAAIKYQVVDGEYTYANGLFEKDSKVYSYNRKADGTASINLNRKYSSMSEVTKEKLSFLFDPTDENYYPFDLFYATEHNKDNEETYYGLNILRYENMFKALLSFVPELGESPDPELFTVGLLGILNEYEEFDKEPESGTMNMNLYSEFDQTVVILDDYLTTAEFVFDFSAAIDSYYEISFKVINIGSTSIPKDIADQFIVKD